MIGCRLTNDINASPFLAPKPLLRRGAPTLRQVVGRVASPDLGGEREAIPSTYATFALHVTTVSYALLSEGAPVELPVWATGFFKSRPVAPPGRGAWCNDQDAERSTKAPGAERRTSDNSVNAKFAEFLFQALG